LKLSIICNWEADVTPEVDTLIHRRRFIQSLAAGTAAATLAGVTYAIAGCSTDDRYMAEMRPDGRRRLPPGQRTVVEAPEQTPQEADETPAEPQRPRLIRTDVTHPEPDRLPKGQDVIDDLRPMGGRAGNPSRGAFEFKVHGLVETPLTLSFEELLEFQHVEQVCDVHCVTGWSVLGVAFKGVRLADIAERVKPSKRARHVIFEAAHGYTANMDIEEALKPNSLIAWEHNGRPLARQHGAPVRNILPDRYFWKSAKWITGVRFQENDERGFWEVRGYHNRGCPWAEERYS
jgi:DMSO/TMAO reductase YedYZ molybdopterin-dependent catalytic subunit